MKGGKKKRPDRPLRWRKLGKESVGRSASVLYHVCLSQLLGLGGTHGPNPGAQPKALPWKKSGLEAKPEKAQGSLS